MVSSKSEKPPVKSGDRPLRALDAGLAPSLMLDCVGGNQLLDDVEVARAETDFDELAKHRDVVFRRHAFSLR